METRFHILWRGDKEKSGSARLGKAAVAGVLHFHLLCFVDIIWDFWTLLPSACLSKGVVGAGLNFPAGECGIQARSDKILAAAAHPVLAFEQLLRTRGGAGFLATPTADSLLSLRNSLG